MLKKISSFFVAIFLSSGDGKIFAVTHRTKFVSRLSSGLPVLLTQCVATTSLQPRRGGGFS